MSFEIGTAADVPDLITKLDAFLCKGHTLDPLYTGAGNGILAGLIGTAASVVETITVTFSDAANFTVGGSVSGALGAGTVGNPFACAVCAFTAQAGGTPWGAGDTISFVGTAPWVQLCFSTSADGVQYSCWKAPGNDGNSEIFVGVRRKMNVTGDYDGLRLNAYTSYNAGLSFYGQTGGMTERGPFLPLLRVGNMPYWFVANGRRCVIIVKVSTVYEAAYLGFITPYMDANSHPYPMLVAGSMAYHTEPAVDSQNWRFSLLGNNHSTFPKAYPGDSSSYEDSYVTRMRRPDGYWSAFGFTGSVPNMHSGKIIPHQSIGTDLRAGLDGSYPVLPINLRESDPINIWGELDGVGWCSGHANTVEDLIWQNNISWLVVQDVYRTSKVSYFAVKLA